MAQEFEFPLLNLFCVLRVTAHYETIFFSFSLKILLEKKNSENSMQLIYREALRTFLFVLISENQRNAYFRCWMCLMVNGEQIRDCLHRTDRTTWSMVRGKRAHQILSVNEETIFIGQIFDMSVRRTAETSTEKCIFPFFYATERRKVRFPLVACLRIRILLKD